MAIDVRIAHVDPQPLAVVRRTVSARELALAGPSWEVYGHWTDDPARLRTDVFHLLQG